MYIAAFPNLRFDAQDVLGSGDKAVARVRVTGTHEGEFMGLPPTGKGVDVQAIDIVRFGDDGLVREHWGVFDAMAMMQQLGVCRGCPNNRLAVWTAGLAPELNAGHPGLPKTFLNTRAAEHVLPSLNSWSSGAFPRRRA
jgi:hypothetical protein